MQSQLEKRLEDLKNELAAGEKMKADLEKQLADLQAAMTRISGAIEVLEEMIAQQDTPTDAAQASES